jgi:glutathione S-transferase
MSCQRNVMQQPAEPRRSIREGKAAGLRNLPCRRHAENAAWLEAVLTGIDLVCWTKLICFADHPTLARCEIAAFRYRVLHVAAQLTRSARQTRLGIDRTWRWATAITAGFARLRAAFP